MTTVDTVLSPVEASDLGFTLRHEHVLLSAAGIDQTYPGFIDQQAVAAEGIVKFKAAYDEPFRLALGMLGCNGSFGGRLRGRGCPATPAGQRGCVRAQRATICEDYTGVATGKRR